MPFCEKLKSTLSEFLAKTSGNAGMMFALSAVPLIGGAGVALDYVRHLDAKTLIQVSADDAVLAGTRALVENANDKSGAVKIAETYFARAVAGREDIDSINITFTVNPNGNGVNATGNALMGTTLTAVLGFDQMELFGPSDALVSSAEAGGGGDGDIEISLVLDVTGSMCDDGIGPCDSATKLNAMKMAANELVDRVMPSSASGDRVKVSVIPFNSHIRVGPDGAGTSIMKSLTNLDSTWTGYQTFCYAGYESGTGTEGSTSWVCTDQRTELRSNLKVRPCVTDRYYEYGSGAFDYTDDAPGSDKWLNARDGTRYFDGYDSKDAIITSRTGLSAADPATNDNYDADGVCWDQPESNQVLPLSTSKDTVKSKIDQLVGYRWTGGTLGISFGWYMLSPNWNAAVQSTEDAGSYAKLTETTASGSKALRKIVVFMSDGAFNSVRGWQDSNFIEPASNGAAAICAAMKDKGIEIYSVAYDLDNVASSESAYALSTMESCGSGLDHFYKSINTTELREAFAEIGTQISGTGQVRLTK